MQKYFTGRAVKRLAKFSGSGNWRRPARQAIALLIATAILNLYATANSAAPNLNVNPAIGTVTITGGVRINGSPGMSGQTLFSGSSIRTLSGAESTLELANRARLRLEAETSLKLESSALGLSASLDDGTVRVFAPAGIVGRMTTADASITADANQPAIFSVLADSCNTTVFVQSGRLEVHSANKIRSVSAGERVSTGGAPALPAPPQNLSGRKKAGLFLGIGGAIAILLMALTGKKKVTETPSFGGCVIILSPNGGVGGC